ncbi:MAG: hypothetical protein WCA32_11930 [Chromatiaceae bacterium]
MLHRHNIGIIGTGQVGMAAAYSLFQQRIANELILIDLDRKRAEGEAMDLMHAQGYAGRRRVRAGDYPDLANAQTPGPAQRGTMDLIIALSPILILVWLMTKPNAKPSHRALPLAALLT